MISLPTLSLVAIVMVASCLAGWLGARMAMARMRELIDEVAALPFEEHEEEARVN